MNRIESRARVGGDEAERRNRLKKKIISTMRERERSHRCWKQKKKRERKKRKKNRTVFRSWRLIRVYSRDISNSNRARRNRERTSPQPQHIRRDLLFLRRSYSPRVVAMMHFRYISFFSIFFSFLAAKLTATSLKNSLLISSRIGNWNLRWISQLITE